MVHYSTYVVDKTIAYYVRHVINTHPNNTPQNAHAHAHRQHHHHDHHHHYHHHQIFRPCSDSQSPPPFPPLSRFSMLPNMHRGGCTRSQIALSKQRDQSNVIQIALSKQRYQSNVIQIALSKQRYQSNVVQVASFARKRADDVIYPTFRGREREGGGGERE